MDIIRVNGDLFFQDMVLQMLESRRWFTSIASYCVRKRLKLIGEGNWHLLEVKDAAKAN